MYYRHNSLRLKNFDYTKPAVYFITMRVNHHLCLFGSINDKKLKLNAAGKMVANVFTNLPKYYTGVFIDTYIVMPDHFHGIIIIDHSGGASLRGRPEIENNTQSLIDRILIPNIHFVINRFNDKYFGGRVQRPAPTDDQLSLGEIVGRFKSYTTTQYIVGVKNNQWNLFDKKLWQRGYYDRIVRDKKAYYAIRNYIANNPLNWTK
jgi:putative transposase